MPRLGLVQLNHLAVEVFGFLKIGAHCVHKMLHTLFAARHGKQLSVSSHIPIPVQIKLTKRRVKRHTMAISFGISQGAIHVKD